MQRRKDFPRCVVLRVEVSRQHATGKLAMSEMLSPLQWVPPESELTMRTVPAKTRHQPFCWPTPPFANYPDATEQSRPEPCEILGLNESRKTGRLIFFVPDESVVHVQVPPARTTVALRFQQFKALTLLTPLAPVAPQGGDPAASMLGQPEPSTYRVMLRGGGEMSGATIGHFELQHGLFLFPPADQNGAVHRMFVPHDAYTTCEVGSRIGELLVEQQAATPEQIEQAAQEQQRLRSRKLGDILLTQKIVTPAQLIEALDQQAKMPMVRIGQSLQTLGLITPAQLDNALAQQKRDRTVPLGELLVHDGVVSRQDLQTALARKMGYPLVELEKFPIEVDAVKRIGFAMARRLRALPLLIREGRLVVAMEDLAQPQVIDELEFAAQMKVVPVLACVGGLDAALRSAYDKAGATMSTQLGLPTMQEAVEYDPGATDKLIESLEREGLEHLRAEDDKQIEQSDNSLVRLINNMIVEAWNQGASDIHVESHPGREKTKIRFRKDGLLQPYLELPHNYRNAMVARIKIMCDLDISERRKPQDGKVNFAKFSPSHRIELRVATIPTNGGLEDVVMRILASAKPIPIDNLGLSPRNLQQLKLASERPYGLILCVGPTGSGKTTTLHSALSHINVPERKIWTAEDPIEITQPGLRQVQVNPKIEWTFAKALRAFLRADPDVIMVGEVRDAETAAVAIEASLTGHLVLSTLHTNSAPETVTRLLDIGMDPFNFADSLLVVLAQRLVRKLCNHCRMMRPATELEVDELLADYLKVCADDDPGPDSPLPRDELRTEWLGRFGRDGKLVMHHSPGCKACNHTGLKGRAGLHELMVVTPELRRLIQTGARAEQLQRTALKDGMRTLRQDGIEKVLAGITTIDEVRAMSNS
jgi:type II secretory ATPase GspE/PulE/Tfp pilus assembly ATPase PilB-like protein